MPRNAPTTTVVPRDELVKLYRQAMVSGVPLDQVDKKIERLLARDVVTQRENSNDEKKVIAKFRKQIPWYVRWGAMGVPAVLMLIGVWLVGNAAVPILNAYLSGASARDLSALVAPVPAHELLEVNPLVIGLARAEETAVGMGRQRVEPIILDNELDFTNLSNWFTGNETVLAGLVPTANSGTHAEDSYILEIPKLKVTNARVQIGGTDLNNGLIQYPGTANPGEKGAPVIFGHSVLRQFYNPSEKNPRRYMSIFSTIMTLQKGDQIYVTHDGIKYTYEVQEKLEVKPEDTYILNQQYDSSQLKLVTCTPEGTYLRRGIVVARLVQ